MLAPFAVALVVLIAGQSPASDRMSAEQLARSGRSAEALKQFEQIVTALAAILGLLGVLPPRGVMAEPSNGRARMGPSHRLAGA
jgi:hypothetical protein